MFHFKDMIFKVNFSAPAPEKGAKAEKIYPPKASTGSDQFTNLYLITQ